MKTQATMTLAALVMAVTYGHGADHYEVNGPPITNLQTTHTYIDPVSNTQIDIILDFEPYRRSVHITHFSETKVDQVNPGYINYFRELMDQKDNVINRVKLDCSGETHEHNSHGRRLKFNWTHGLYKVQQKSVTHRAYFSNNKADKANGHSLGKECDYINQYLKEFGAPDAFKYQKFYPLNCDLNGANRD